MTALMVLLAALGGPPAAAEPLVLEDKEFDPAAWDAVLVAHVRDGVLDHAAITPGETAALDAMLAAAGDHKLTATFGKEPRAAFLVNVYNAWAARQVLANPGAASLDDIPGFFDANRIRVSGEERSLDEIEALLPSVFPEQPLTLFALSPGGAGYPLIPRRAYTGANLVETATECFVEYIGRPGFGKDEATKSVRLPAAIERHPEWFAAGEQGMIGVIGPHLSVGTVVALSGGDTPIVYEKPSGRIPGRGDEAGGKAGSGEGSGW